MNKSLHNVFTFFLKSLPVIVVFTIALNAYSQENPYKNHPALNAKDFIRSEQFTGNRTDINGSMRSYVVTSNQIKDSIRKIITARQSAQGNSQRQSSTNRNIYKPVQFYPLGPSVTTDTVFAQLGLVSALWVDSTDYKTIYAGSNTGGIFATYDGGQNWQSLSDEYITTGVLAIEVDPKDKQHIYIGTGHWGFSREWGEGVMQSFDGGKTWQTTGLNAGSINAGFIVHDIKHLDKTTDTLIAIVNREFRQGTSIYRSTDRGNTWNEVFYRNKEELFDIVKAPYNPNLIYTVGSLYLRSNDGGVTWEDLTSEIALLKDHKISRMALAISHSPSHKILAFVESYDTLTPGNYDHWLMQYPGDGIRHFKNVGIKYHPVVGYWKMEIQFSPTHHDEFYLGGIWFFKYRLEGDSAKYLSYKNHRYHKDVRELLVFKGPQDDIVIMGNDGGVTRSDDGAVRWYDITRNGLQSTQFYNLAIAGKSNMVFCGPQDGNLCFYNYNTGEWTKDPHIGDAYDGLVDYNNPRNVYLVTYPPKPQYKNIFLLKSTDGGLIFNYRGVPDTTEQGRNNVPIAMDAKNPKILYAGLKNVWKSTDGAETWTKISNFRPGNTHKIQAIDVAPSNPNVICISFENPAWGETELEKIMITTNGGETWNDITPRGALNLQWVSCVDIQFHPENHNIIFLALDRMWTNNRIYVTLNGGKTWANFSQGLPNIPVNAIKFYKGADYDIMFAATDVGVYYRDSMMDQWEMFGEGIPLTIISDLDINYERKKLVVTTFGRGLWEADICLPLDDEARVITGNVAWNTGKNLLSDLILTPDSKLTMSGTIQVGDGRSITIMPGAELILDNATLTNNCRSLWDGIKLYGYYDYSSDNPQGKITLINGSTIQNSYRGIETFSVDKAGNVDSLRGGGIIITKEAYFKNVLRPVILKPTKGDNPSRFHTTEFAINDQPWPGEQFIEFVRMEYNRGVEFINCIFRNDISYNSLPIEERGIGINSFNSSFSVYKMNPDTAIIGLSIKPMFHQLNKGIYAITSTPGYTFYSNGVTYKNNYTGAYLAGYSNLVAVDNSFELKPLSHNATNNRQITGLYLDNSQNYLISNNIFRTFPNIGVYTALIGMISNNSGDQNNLVANNRFETLTYAILAQNKNRSTDGSSGLRLLFNKFNKNKYGIVVTHDSLSQINGIARYQGVAGHQEMEPAGNSFFNSIINKTADLHNEGEPFVYSHYINKNNSTGQVPKSGNVHLLSAVYPMPVDSTYVPDYLKIDTSNVNTAREQWRSIYTSDKDKYLSLKDGGDTQALINESVSLKPGNTAELYKKFRELDSRLSREFLRELVKKNKFPNSLLIEVLVQNPIIFKDTVIMQSILERDPPMSDYMLQRLNGLSDRYSSIEIFESAHDNSKAIFDAITAIAVNKECINNPGDITSVDELLAEEPDNIHSQITRAFMQHTHGNSEQAETILKSITADHDQKQSIDNLISLMKFDKSINTTLPDEFSKEQLSLLNSIGADNFTSIYIANINNRFLQGSYNEPYILPTEAPALRDYTFPGSAVVGSSFRIYPQPAQGYLIIDYHYEFGFYKGTIEFTNASGQTVSTVQLKGKTGQEFVNISEWTPGIYFVRLINNGSVIENQKIMVIK